MVYLRQTNKVPEQETHVCGTHQ